MVKKIEVIINIKYVMYFKLFFPYINVEPKNIPIHAALEFVNTVAKDIPKVKKYVDTFLKVSSFRIIKDARQNGQIEINQEPA